MTSKFLAVTVLCHMFSVTSFLAQENHYVFSLSVTYDEQEFSVNFSMDRFIEFYRCLCKTGSASCTAFAELHKVIYIQEYDLDHHHTQLYTYYNRHVCEHVRYENAVTCSKLQTNQVNCSNTHNCLSYRIPKEAASTCSFGRADLVWKLGQHVSGNYVYGVIDVKPCHPECVVVNMETASRFDNASSTSFSNISTVLPFVDTVVNSNATLLLSSGSDESSSLDNSADKTSLIIGLLVASVIVVSISIIIVVFMWRLRRSSSFVKTSKDSSPTTHNTPTLIQLHHIDVIYANDESLYAGIKTPHIHTSTDPELDSCWSAGFSDSTEYEPDFSDFYNESNISLEESQVYANPCEETRSEIYENYSRPMAVCLCKPDVEFGNNLPSDYFVGQNVLEMHDDLIYEDFDRSGFDQALPVVDECAEREETTCSTSSTRKELSSAHARVVKENSFRNTTLSVLKSGVENCRGRDKEDESEPKNGYSKLNEKPAVFKESYNNFSGSLSLADRHRNPLCPAVMSSEDICQSAEQPIRYSLTYDPVEVIEVALSPKLYTRGTPTGIPPISDQMSSTGSGAANKNSPVEAVTTQAQERSHFKKAQAYFELESQFRNKQKVGDLCVEIQEDIKGDKKYTGDKHKI